MSTTTRHIDTTYSNNTTGGQQLMSLPKNVHDRMQNGVSNLMDALKVAKSEELHPRIIKDLTKTVNEVLKLFQRSK